MRRKPTGRFALLALGLWFVTTSVRAHPFFLAYLNEAVGGSQRGYDCLTDSNIDWGQGLRELRRYLNGVNVGGIYLSYFGTAEPKAYGIRSVSAAPYTIPAFSDDDFDLKAEKRTLLVISATNYQGTYFSDPNVFGWLKGRRPKTVLADSLLVFDVTNDIESHQRLADVFERMGKFKTALREREWIGELLSQRKSENF